MCIHSRVPVLCLAKRIPQAGIESASLHEDVPGYRDGQWLYCTRFIRGSQRETPSEQLRQIDSVEAQLLARRKTVRDRGEGAAEVPHQQSTSEQNLGLDSPSPSPPQSSHAEWPKPLKPPYPTKIDYNPAAMFSLHAIRSRLPRRCIAATSVRTYASQTPGNPMLEVFNRKTKHLQKDRAARNVEESRKVDYLKDEVALRLCERLLVRNPTKQGLRL